MKSTAKCDNVLFAGVLFVLSIIRRLRIQTVKANLEFNRIVCSSLANEFNRGVHTTEEYIAIVRQWDAVAREGRALRALLESLERQEKAGHGDPDVWTNA